MKKVVCIVLPLNLFYDDFESNLNLTSKPTQDLIIELKSSCPKLILNTNKLTITPNEWENPTNNNAQAGIQSDSCTVTLSASKNYGDGSGVEHTPVSEPTGA